jgi:hypothetical protein
VLPVTALVAGSFLSIGWGRSRPGRLTAADLPRRSATVTDECMEIPAPAQRAGAIHHGKKQMPRRK